MSPTTYKRGFRRKNGAQQQGRVARLPELRPSALPRGSNAAPILPHLRRAAGVFSKSSEAGDLGDVCAMAHRPSSTLQMHLTETAENYRCQASVGCVMS